MAKNVLLFSFFFIEMIEFKLLQIIQIVKSIKIDKKKFGKRNSKVP